MVTQTSSSTRVPVRLSLPSKGRLSDDSLEFLKACDLAVEKPNPRQYQAIIPSIPELVVLFQRPGDIVTSVRDGSVDFGITGLDVIEEHKGDSNSVLILHEALNFGQCALTLAVPEEWVDVSDVSTLRLHAADLNHILRVATKYPNLTGRFLNSLNIPHTLIFAEGTLENAPAIGYADMISDLVSSGQTLRDNRLKPLPDGVILRSQAALISNLNVLKQNPLALQTARYLLEYFEAHLRAQENMSIFANMRGSSPQAIADRLFSQDSLGGLQGPTISQVIVREKDPNWYAVNIIVHRSQLFKTINELRSIGGSGVVVLPVSYIFEEEPPRYTAMLKILQGNSTK